MTDLTIQVDDNLLERFKLACEAIGVVAADYLELCVNKIIEEHVDDVASAPGIEDARCRIDRGDVVRGGNRRNR